MSKDVVQAMDLLEAEKGISREVIKEAIEAALVHAYKKNYENAQNVEVLFNIETGDIKVFSVKEVVETNYDPTIEISLEEAHQIHQAYEIGDTIKIEVTPQDFGRIATQTAKHVVMQKLREAEREIIYNEFIDYEDEILTGVVERTDARFVYVNIGKVEAVMPVREQIPGEEFDFNDRIKVYVVSVDKTTKGPQVIVSRAHVNFLKRLFEQEVPEIYDGIVEIRALAREAGDRSKVAVYSRDEQIDPVGTCVGQRGSRVQLIVDELHGENMDIVKYDEDPAVFIKNAMSPAHVLDVVFLDENVCIVVVPDDQLSLAIGKRGQNARLAAKLTGYKIDIKSESEFDPDDYIQATEDELEPNDEELDLIEDSEENLNAEEIEPSLEEIEQVESTHYSDELMEEWDVDEQNVTPEQAEQEIAEVEDDGEQDYEELLDEFQTEQTE
ncbi:transcription termination factor NusA [Falseniella ignava]|uniref:Transcription termination/antitermination protein NusA n=1 Tax=Falseniella ignava CCUG 37419 TaxID=883112 RepID=K1M5Q2_9LACT|nr:transcription termination factor NusA [Falseniella ignava]EKB57693.1 transcription termination factor NusA [Falseniella ignava CCUG 37419]